MFPSAHRRFSASSALALALFACGDTGGDDTVCAPPAERGPDGRCREVVACEPGHEPVAGVCAQPDCAPGERDDGGTCVAAGLDPDRCPPGSRDVDGTCIEAGVDPDGCGEGFVHDGDHACEPVLPRNTCAVGSMAVIGNPQCQPIATCGDSTWGDIPVEPNTQFVDQSFVGTSDGTADNPWTTVTAATDAAEPGAIVAIAAGRYLEDLRLHKPLRVMGRCPDMVEIAPPGPAFGVAIGFYAGADGSEVRGLALTGDANLDDHTVGLVVSEVAVVGEHLWIHDTYFGVFAERAGGHLTLRNSLVEDTDETGVAAHSAELVAEHIHVRRAGHHGIAAVPSDLTTRPRLDVTAALLEHNGASGLSCATCDTVVRDSVIRHSTATTSEGGTNGMGIAAAPINLPFGKFGEPPDVTIDRCHLVDNQTAGIAVLGGTVSIDHTVVRDTREWDSFESGLTRAGYGIQITHVPNGDPATGSIRNTTITDCIASGVNIASSTVTLEGVLVRDTQPVQLGEIANSAGTGLQVLSEHPDDPKPNVTVLGSHFARNHAAGIAINDGTLTVDATLIADTFEDAQPAGFGITANSFGHHPTELDVRHTHIADSHGAGIFTAGDVVATVAASRIERTIENALGLGAGVLVQPSPHTGVAASVTLLSVEILDGEDAGIAVFGSSLTANGVVITGTRANTAGAFGDAVQAAATTQPATVTLHSVRARDSARAAVSNFGSVVSFSAVELLCQAFDLNGENTDQPFGFDLGGYDSCGCPTTERRCQVVSSGLQALTPLE